MSLYLDQKYLSLVSNRLPLFKKKNDSLYNCRCVICGDSVKNKHKARGYFFNFKNELRYKCHNCDVSMTFGSFLKKLDTLLYSQYTLEKYSEGAPLKSNNTTFVFEQPVFKNNQEKVLDKLLKRLDLLPEDNEAVLFCKKRKIPTAKFNKLYFIDSVNNIAELNESYRSSVRGNEPRLVLPFYNVDGRLTGVTCRALRGEALRYITVRIEDNQPLLFGIKEVDTSKTVYAVEGPIDSLFLENCIAVAGTSFGKINSLNLNIEDLVLVFDNQPRNKEVCDIIERNINLGHKVVIWPQTLVEKDINEMVLAGIDVTSLVKKNTFNGLTAKAKFIAWRRCS